MRYTYVLVVLIAATGTANGQSPTELVDRAIKVHGGAEALAKMKAFEKSARGKCILIGSELDATVEAKLALPDRAHFTIDMALPDKSKVKTVIGLNGLTGWVRANNDAAKDLPPGQYDLITDEAWVHWMATLAPLTNKKMTLAAAGVIQVDGQPADGVRITKEGKPEVVLYFSKASGLLVKVHSRLREGGGTIKKDWVFSAHRDFSSVQLPTKIVETKNETREAEWLAVEYKFVEKFDLAIFRRP